MDTKVKCFICNNEYYQLGSHITRTHSMKVSEYKNLYPTSNLMSQYVRHKKSTNVVSPYKRSSWVNKGYTEEEATALVARYQENNSKMNQLRSPRTLQHWIDKGYNKDDAKFLLARFQDNRSLSKLELKFGSLELAKANYKWNPKSTLKSGTNNTSVRTLSYWIDCGFSLEDAQQLVSAVQSRSIDYFVEKYGPDIGNEKYNSWLQKIIKTTGSVSKESLTFFETLLECVPTIKSEAIYGAEELVLEHNNGFYKYDFTIPSLFVIIEYNGVAWHPKSENDTWVHPHKLYTAKEKFELDTKKIDFAKSKGYKVFTVFSDDNKDNAIKHILKELNIYGTN